MPSPDPKKPGLYIRDPYHYSDSTLLIPPPLVQALECFDGEQTALELRAELVRITGEIQVGEIEKDLFDSLNDAGFLENDSYREMKVRREAEFAAERTREPIFAGSAYPQSKVMLRDLLTSRIGAPLGSASTAAIAAPACQPRWRLGHLQGCLSGPSFSRTGSRKTFLILGTSHYGAPNRFGLTRKNFLTPFGESRTNVDLVNELESSAPGAIRMEDYCHAVEHSIEFQVVFLQHLYGPDVKVVPILCGPFVKSIYEGGLPDDDVEVARFLGALGNLGSRHKEQLFWVLGIDMAHMGARYGDPIRATANVGEMLAIEQRDRERIAQINAGDINAYWSSVQKGHDDMKWCGSSPLYTFMKVCPEMRGELLNYHQWQIDSQSVVSFGAMRFE